MFYSSRIIISYGIQKGRALFKLCNFARDRRCRCIGCAFEFVISYTAASVLMLTVSTAVQNTIAAGPHMLSPSMV